MNDLARSVDSTKPPANVLPGEIQVKPEVKVTAKTCKFPESTGKSRDLDSDLLAVDSTIPLFFLL